MAKAVRKAAKDSKKKGEELKKASKEEEEKEEKDTMDEEYKDITKPTRMGGVSPQMKADARAIRLQATEPGSKREKTQTRRSQQLNRLVHSGANQARRSMKEDSLDENRFAAHGGKDTDAGAKYAKPSKTKDSGKVYSIKGKDGKPLFKEGVGLDEELSPEEKRKKREEIAAKRAANQEAEK